MYAAMLCWAAPLHTHVTDEQSHRGRRLLMTDTMLILSGANWVSRGPQGEKESNSALAGDGGGCFVLCSCHSSIVSPSVLPLSFSSPTTSPCLSRKEDWQQGSSVIWDTRERDPFTSKMSYCNRLPMRPQLQKHGMAGHVSYGLGGWGCRPIRICR